MVVLSDLQQDLEVKAFSDDKGKAIKADGYGYIIAWGKTVPSDGDTGYSNSCLFIHIDASTLDTRLYINVGDLDSANFDALDLTLA